MTEPCQIVADAIPVNPMAMFSETRLVYRCLTHNCVMELEPERGLCIEGRLQRLERLVGHLIEGD